jgi:hypothetical protein
MQAPTATGKPVNMTCDPVTLLWPPTPLDVQARPRPGPRGRYAPAQILAAQVASVRTENAGTKSAFTVDALHVARPR